MDERFSLNEYRRIMRSHDTCRVILAVMCSNPIIRALNLRFHWFSLMMVPPITEESTVYVIGPVTGWDTFHYQWKADKKALKKMGVSIYDLTWSAGDIAAIL